MIPQLIISPLFLLLQFSILVHVPKVLFYYGHACSFFAVVRKLFKFSTPIAASSAADGAAADLCSLGQIQSDFNSWYHNTWNQAVSAVESVLLQSWQSASSFSVPDELDISWTVLRHYIAGLVDLAWSLISQLWHQLRESYRVTSTEGTWELVLVQLGWLLVMIAAWHMTYILRKKFFRFFQPIGCYVWLCKRILSGKIWRLYRGLLAVPTRWCYRHRRTLLALGELLMFPIVIAWFAWPMMLPFWFWRKAKWLYYLVIPSSVFLLWMAKNIVRQNWKDLSAGKEPEPELLQVSCLQLVFRLLCLYHLFSLWFRVLQLLEVIPALPSTGGMQLKIKAKKPKKFKLEQARLSLVRWGDDSFLSGCWLSHHQWAFLGCSWLDSWQFYHQCRTICLASKYE